MFPNKINLPTAVKEFSKFKLRPKHITSMDWMELNVALCMELVPKSKINNLKHELFSRLEPLQKPPFANAYYRNKVFWVPFRTVFPGWNDFINDTPHVFQDGSSSIISRVPNILNETFFLFFIQAGVSYEVDYEAGSDFTYLSGGATKYRRLTSYGRFAYKIIKSLGYSPIMEETNSLSYSAMPLLCLFKLYYDWFFPSQYANDSMTTAFAALLTNNNPINYNIGHVGLQQLSNLFLVLYNISYDPDYFTSAWDTPNSPNDSLSSSFTIPDITNGSSLSYSRQVVSSSNQSSNSGANNAPLLTGGTGGISSVSSLSMISQYALTALRSLSDYLKRHQLVGSRAIDRYLARWGTKLSSEKLNRSVLVSSYNQSIKFGDVTSTASTDTANLGDYAGKGISYGNGNLSFDPGDEYGILFVITTVMPDIDYYQGINRHILHESKLDFYTPEFDALGVQAISKLELYSPMSASASVANGLGSGVFGFTPRYAEYKKHTSLLTGDFSLRSRNVGEDSWHLFRNIDAYINSDDDPSNIVDDIVHDYDFVVGADKKQFNRIFQLTNGETDQFKVVHQFDIDMSFPGKPLFDTYEFDNEGESPRVNVSLNGETVS